jgi:hypothetical protein
MRRSMLLLLFLSLGLAACVSFSGSSRPAPQTIVVPPGSKVYCSDGSAPPCR